MLKLNRKYANVIAVLAYLTTDDKREYVNRLLFVKLDVRLSTSPKT